MANSNKFAVKNGLQTQNIDFVSSDKINTISLNMLDSDTLSVSGNSGQLFSITDNLTGTIFSVNDISGIPSIEVLDSGLVKLAEYSGNILIGTNVDNTTDRLQVNGSINATHFISSAGELPVFIQNTQPTGITSKYLWVQTGLGSGSDFTFWFDDGA